VITPQNHRDTKTRPPGRTLDLRRTARTQLAALGVRREVAERCLGHAIRGAEGTYDRHNYFKERRTALEQWTGLLIEAERVGARSSRYTGRHVRAAGITCASPDRGCS
jgi:hypothetical protein